jgi:uncharacterized RDD family membrane protein YckC
MHHSFAVTAPSLPAAFMGPPGGDGMGTSELAAPGLPPVWVDPQSGFYYFSCNRRRYGQTPGGRYMGQTAALAQGYRSDAKRQ